MDLPALAGTGVYWVDHVGHHLIDNVTIEIGGQTIDQHYGTWLQIWNELTQTAEKEAGYNSMIGNDAERTGAGASIDATTLYVPLQFWFCKNPGLALPLIALQYHEVKFNIQFAAFSHLTRGTSPVASDPLGASLYVDYIYLDTDERRQFAQVQHENNVLKSKHQMCLLVSVNV